MDVPRKSQALKKKIKLAVSIILVIIVGAAITVVLAKMKPAAQSVDGGTLYPGTARRGKMVREVRGLGTLVPEEITWIPSVTEGRVDKIVLRAGTRVTPGSVILEMSNPQLQQETLDAELNVKSAEFEYKDTEVQLRSKHLDDEANAAKIQSDLHQAQLVADTNEQLGKQGLKGELEVKLSRVTADELANRSRLENKRLEISDESIKAQLAVKQASVDQRRELYKLKKSQLDALTVRAGTEGMLQLVPVEVGQRVTPGTNLARVANPAKLKAELKIAETQAKDVQIGQPVLIDTRNGVIKGRVIRKDPSVQNATVTVDASLDEALPKGAVPDLSVEGTVELERLEDVLFVERPVHGQENSTVGLFKYDEDQKYASRVQVKFGRSSVSTIEILEGLKAGDKVILSDTSQFDGVDRIRIN